MQLLENNHEYLDDFIKLNEEWISCYFKIEEIDKTLANNPQKILDDGGYIFTLLENNVVVGTCALFNEGNGIYELAKMAVTPKYQGNKLGDKLMLACFAKLKEIKAKKVYLVSNTKLTAAISLYKKHGFKTVLTGHHPVYTRANIVMEKDISQ